MFVVFDLDGTLSDPTHRNALFACPKRGLPHLREDMTDRDWFDYHRMSGLDAPVWPIIQTMQAFTHARHRVEIWTARSDSTEWLTDQWLSQRAIAPMKLRMRKASDKTPDFELKLKWMREFGRPDLVFEDRQRVVDMWRAHGVMCAQVAPGNF